MKTFKYLDFLKDLADGKYSTETLRIKVVNDEENEHIYRLGECGFADEDGFYLLDEYSDLDILTLEIGVLDDTEITENSPESIAKKQVIAWVEKAYMDLDMALDNCQGCCDGVDEKFATLRIYEDLVKHLGGDIKSHIQELTDNWFAENRKRVEQEEKEQAERDKVITKLKLPIFNMLDTAGEDVVNALWKVQDKINEICEILINMKKL